MAEFVFILRILIATFVVVAPFVLVVAVLRGAEPFSLADIFAAPNADGWPRGVQEEEPVRWNFGGAN